MADLMDAVWQNGPEMAPKWLSGPVHAERPKAKNPRRSADSDVVEVRRLELLTPYMRSSSGKKTEKPKKPRNSKKRQ
jgi:hypothetical protein